MSPVGGLRYYPGSAYGVWVTGMEGHGQWTLAKQDVEDLIGRWTA